MSAVVKTDIDRMIAEYRDGYTLPQAFYRSADIFAHDMENVSIRGCSARLNKLRR